MKDIFSNSVLGSGSVLFTLNHKQWRHSCDTQSHSLAATLKFFFFFFLNLFRALPPRTRTVVCEQLTHCLREILNEES